MMGHANMAAAAVRYLRRPGRPPPAGKRFPRPESRCVGSDERAPVGPSAFREVLGNFATGVTVVTAPAPADGSAPPAGFACQSFAALSLEPPLVTFLVGRSSATWPRIARTGSFCVNILSERQGDLCRSFAVSGAAGGDKFAGVAHDRSPATGAPRLAGAVAWVDCAVHAVHPGGDHLIVVGRVLALGRDDVAPPPLVFHRGRLTSLCPE
ncbi:flavin reductase family protein [Streptomyces sp. HSG2]|uniref:flavin reductase family protein n=1 Tax=Streptomyces sp. HSG2 TaxID=2797167 RepID=UPI001904B8E7|nr:flavin reductase family protein [Streptomyces sp. HSG2]